MKKKITIILLLLITISGCANNTGNLVIKSDDTVILTVLAGQSTSDAGVDEMIDEKLSERYPNVKLEWECVDWGEDFDAQMQARFSSGDIPDIMIGKAQDVTAYASTGNLALISEECISKINIEARESVSINGIAYGLPYNALYQGVIYNKDIFRQYGLSVPATVEQLDQIIMKLKENNITPFASHYQESWSVGNTTMQFFMNEVFREEPTWGEDFRQGLVSFSDSEDIIYCLENNKKILDNSWEDAMCIDQFESDNRFTKGQAAMYVTGSWSLQFADQYDEAGEYGIFPYPNQRGNALLIRETNMTFMKSSKSEYGDLIDDIFNMLLTDENLVEEILDFTQSSSVIEGVTPIFYSCIQEDIDFYEKNKQVIDVTIGNTQLVWTFQNDLAMYQLSWLQGEKTLEEVLSYADAHREESINE